MRESQVLPLGLGGCIFLFGLFLVSNPAMAMDPQKSKVVEHWTQERMDQALPRDLVIDPRGLGYLRMPDGSFQPHGHQIAAEQGASKPEPKGKPSGSDTTPPSISGMNPAAGDIITSSYTFEALVEDESGVKSVSFIVIYPNGTTTQSFNANQDSQNSSRWYVNLQGFTPGSWGWRVEAKDWGDKGGVTGTSPDVNFCVDSCDGSGSSSQNTGDTVTNSVWTSGGTVQTAAGRIYFEMPKNLNWKGPWQGYVCSGTVVTDIYNDRSIILTAAHCVYDDENKAFARNVLFIPDQAQTTGSGTDLNCNNDPLGCWAPSFGVVDKDWTARVFPDNIQWDYAYYVVNNSGAHAGNGTSEILDSATGTLNIQFDAAPVIDDGIAGGGSSDFSHALGYSYNEDPKFMYCAEDMTTNGSVNWWLPSCDLSGGSSGGPWMQPVTGGDGPVISVNSWGYTTSPGMAGPKLNDGASTASCLFSTAETGGELGISYPDGYAGIVQDPAACP